MRMRRPWAGGGRHVWLVGCSWLAPRGAAPAALSPRCAPGAPQERACVRACVCVHGGKLGVWAWAWGGWHRERGERRRKNAAAAALRCILVRLTERGARRAGVRAAPAAALPMLPPPQPAVTLSRPPRPDRSSRRSHRAPPAADVAPRLLQLPEDRHGDRGMRVGPGVSLRAGGDR